MPRPPQLNTSPTKAPHHLPLTLDFLTFKCCFFITKIIILSRKSTLPLKTRSISWWMDPHLTSPSFCVYVLEETHEGRHLLQMSFSITLSFFFEAGSLTFTRTHRFCQPASLPAMEPQRFSYLCFPSTEVGGYGAMFLGRTLRFLCLSVEHFTNWVISLPLSWIFTSLNDCFYFHFRL